MSAGEDSEWGHAYEAEDDLRSRGLPGHESPEVVLDARKRHLLPHDYDTVSPGRRRCRMVYRDVVGAFDEVPEDPPVAVGVVELLAADRQEGPLLGRAIDPHQGPVRPQAVLGGLDGDQGRGRIDGQVVAGELSEHD